MTRRTVLRTLGRRTAGLAFLLVLAMLVTLSVRIYQKDFVPAVMVTLETDRVGNQLRPTAEVKARGVVVGEVREIRGRPGGAAVVLALDPRWVDRLPKDVSALLVPKTLFGERYVQLSIPDSPTLPPLAEGDVIGQDRSANAIELERVFDNLLPVLRAVRPEKLATSLTAVATALEGRGEQLGDTLAAAADYLERFNPSLPRLHENIRDLAEVSRLYGDIAPDLLDSLTDTAVTLRTVTEHRAGLDDLYARVTGSSQDVTTFLRANRDNIVLLTANSRAPLELAARYSPSFPCTLAALDELRGSMDRVLGADPGDDRPPGMHIEAAVTPDRGKYLPGVDDPAYTATGGPRCYPSGVPPTSGVAAAAPGDAGAVAAMPGGNLGLPNSPQERELLATLLAVELGVPPAEVPAWGGVLVGPLYRGTEVTLEGEPPR
ncbi:phospholipid/cholesterol/gamma-HCH transport system substrate-binding protein [Amycolatopsis arida]|uniref:Phospholipid/cholesterol/gamma-HCH transport system substrate-binding protein n=1 Tax=Amycolatopsis arida TaxID=587909 RepID=A0A1I5K808_9PSEU|nr:MCE family protein [Amycolatopsis arida]TDX96912.1 phospholipid/cholesterol/gamma-HCH transport system substrate-binding protein [Amycolatopsis arida]SFO80761.1 phospholipid/cholesterol/gamma-HCH transport system substrate-binding protein [Amycolatopsis arida]